MAPSTRRSLRQQLDAERRRNAQLEKLLAPGIFRRPEFTIPYADTPRYKGGFGVESDSKRGKIYKVAFDTAIGAWACSCPGGINYGRCKHLKRYGLKGRADGELQPTPTFAPPPPNAKQMQPTAAMMRPPVRRFGSAEEV